MGSRALLGGLGLLLLILVGAMAALRQRTVQEPGRDTPSVEKPGSSAPRTEETHAGWLGLIISEESLDVATRVEGRVESVKVQVGSVVRQGEVLVKLDARSLREDLAMAEAELLSSKAELEVALASLEQARERLARRERPEQLKLQAISEEELSTARYEQRMTLAKWEVARAKVQENEVRVELDGFQYEYRELTIESVGEQLIGPGELKRYLGPDLADTVEITGPIVLVRAALPSRTFSVRGRVLGYFEGMPARAQVAVRAEPILVAMIPGLKVLFPHDD